MRQPTRTTSETGPPPLTSDWYAAGSPPPPRRDPITLPGERRASSGLVLSLSLLIGVAALIEEVVWRYGRVPGATASQRAVQIPAPNLSSDVAAVVARQAATPVSDAAAAPTAPPAAPTAAPPAVAAAPTVAAPTVPPAAAPPAEGFVSAAYSGANGVSLAAGEGWFPKYRILTYYGHPHDPNMGIVGEYEMPQLFEILKQEAANYEAVDPSRPVIPAFELIATVAQRDPGDNGDYLLETDLETLWEYTNYAKEQGALVFLDVQIGRGTVAAEIEKVRPLLAEPHVHLAIDPEFAIKAGETPGIHIGEVTASQVRYAQDTLAEIVRENNLPPKVLIVHQFREDMIVGKDEIAPVPNVQLVIDADGFGPPKIKTDVYNYLVRDEPVEWGGVKLFYKQDVPLMTPADILGLTPSPDLIIYQ